MAFAPLAPWRSAADIRKILTAIEEIQTKMADNSQQLNDIAQGLTALVGPLAAVMEENRQLRGEDAGESAATLNVQAAYRELAKAFEGPETPDVPALPDTPAQPGPDGVEQPALDDSTPDTAPVEPAPADNEGRTA